LLVGHRAVTVPHPARARAGLATYARTVLPPEHRNPSDLASNRHEAEAEAHSPPSNKVDSGKITFLSGETRPRNGGTRFQSEAMVTGGAGEGRIIF
jgi:hypothetical protein